MSDEAKVPYEPYQVVDETRRGIRQVLVLDRRNFQLCEVRTAYGDQYELAKLFAASPQLLAACKRLLPLLPYWSIDIEHESQADEIEKALSELKAAVKAAEGDQPCH